MFDLTKRRVFLSKLDVQECRPKTRETRGMVAHIAIAVPCIDEDEATRAIPIRRQCVQMFARKLLLTAIEDRTTQGAVRSAVEVMNPHVNALQRSDSQLQCPSFDEGEQIGVKSQGVSGKSHGLRRDRP